MVLYNLYSSPHETVTIYLHKVTASTLPGEISTRLDEDLGLVGHERKQVCTKSLIFTLSFTDHSCSLLDISFYLRIHDPDEDQRSALNLQAEWPSARSSMMTTLRHWVLGRFRVWFSGHVQCMDGYVLTCPFLVVWPTFLVNSPYDPPFNLYRWRGPFECGVGDRYEQQWSFKWARTSGVSE